jgi:CTP synthase (UTP-ammonia lyase)
MQDPRRASRIALVGDRSDAVVAHAAIPIAIELAAKALGAELAGEWVPSPAGGDVGAFDGIWCVPGSPYESMEGVLTAIRIARERGIPFLGTCGGFQHAMIEYARNVRGVAAAEHAESSPESASAIVTPLACSLVEISAPVALVAGSRLHAAYETPEVHEEYHCRYGLDPAWRARLEDADLWFTAFDAAGDVRGAELRSHPFFIATLFQPERAALRGAVPPLVRAFASALLAR